MRSMIEANGHFFNHLKRQAKDILNKDDFHPNIYIGLTKRQQDYLQNISSHAGEYQNNLKVYDITNEIKIVEYFHNNARYFVVKFPPDTYVDTSESTELMEPSPDVVLALAERQFIDLRSDIIAHRLYDELIYIDHSQEKIPRRIDWESIIDFLDYFTVIKVNPSSQLNTYSRERAILYILSKFNFGANKDSVDRNIYTKIEELVTRDLDNPPYTLIANGLANIKNKHTLYLSLYKTIERLYAKPSISDLRDRIQSQLSVDELGKNIEISLGWRQDEQSGLTKVLESINALSLNNLYDALSPYPIEDLTQSPEKINNKVIALSVLEAQLDSLTADNDENRNQEKITEISKAVAEQVKEIRKMKLNYCSKLIYKVRNYMVHFRPIFDNSVSEKSIPYYCDALVSVVTEIYS